VLPSLGAPGGAPARQAPFALAGALLAIFALQELAEAFLLGGGTTGLAASASVAWLAPPLALLLGALASGLIGSLERTADLLAAPPRRRAARLRPSLIGLLPPMPRVLAAACAGLEFGFARRPPPVSG
jgi:hypothetical protein